MHTIWVKKNKDFGFESVNTMAKKGKDFPHFQNFYYPATKDIYSLAISTSLRTLKFEVLTQILWKSPLKTEIGISLRKLIVETGLLDVILNCLNIFTNSNANLVTELTGKKEDSIIGAGTGSWNAEQALAKQKYKEQHIRTILELLSCYINPDDDENIDPENYNLPPTFVEILKKSCLIPVLFSYLRNDSVLDIKEKIPLYHTILDLLKAMASSPGLSSLLIMKHESDSETIASLVDNLRSCVEKYFLNLHKSKCVLSYHDGMRELEGDLLATAVVIQSACSLIEENPTENDQNETIERPMSVEEKYLEVMKKLQFGCFEIIGALPFGSKEPYAFQMYALIAGNQSHSGRNKRLAQEASTLSTCLPLSFNSSIFVRQDEDRMDVMKCLITGSSNTPYSNGCFEFDIYFPPNYPNAPVALSYKTVTGNNMASADYINPNLYNNGQVCLSILNTWDGSPQSRWNPQKSLMEVLIAIQTSVFVAEPYFNEPAYEKIRGTAKGDFESRIYTCRTYILSIHWAIIQQIRNPSGCFKDVINTHFWLKRNDICKQVQNWIDEVKSHSQDSEHAIEYIRLSETLKSMYQELRTLLSQLPVPENLKDFNNPFDY